MPESGAHALSYTQRMSELVLFSLEEAHFDLRSRLGTGVGPKS